MSKFWSVILKIIIVISILGIIFFVGIAIFKNQNISFEAYNYISSVKNRADFDTLNANITNNVKVAFDGEKDPYANYINSAVKELNEGIDYFTDYLVHEDSLSKGEQDKLVNLYDKYVKGFYSTEKIYYEYLDAYKLAQEQGDGYEQNDYLRASVTAYATYLVNEYISCYKNGAEFFKYLTQIINKYTLSNTGLFSYKAQNYMIKCGLVEYSLDFVTENMVRREKDQKDDYISNPRTNELVDNYYLYLDSESKYTDENSVTDTAFKNFKNNLNTINIFEWAGNYSNYVKTLNEELESNASNALAFYNNNFKG